MKKVRIFLIILMILFLFLFIRNIYLLNVTGHQKVELIVSTQNNSNSKLYFSTIVRNNHTSEVVDNPKVTATLLDLDSHKVHGSKFVKNDDEMYIEVPDVEPGNYKLKLDVSSKAGKDTLYKDIAISKDESKNVIISFDKGIYKPGDEVNFRALIVNSNSHTPIEEDVNISIYDGNDNRVYNEDVKTSEYGIVSGKFKLGTEVNSGIYSLKLTLGNFTKVENFKVNPYVLPKYEIKIQNDKEIYLSRDKAIITVDANYFFGEPVKNANVNLYINNQYIKSTNTDENGIATFEYNVNKKGIYDVKVEAIDSSNYYVDASSSFVASDDKYIVNLYPEFGKVIKNEKNNFYVTINDVYGNPVKAYINVFTENYKKQIVTDDYGIGTFSLDIENDDVSVIDLTIETALGENLHEVFDFNANDAQAIYVKTDKLKYENGEKIKLEIIGNIEKEEIVCFYKGDKLIKTVKTNTNEIEVELGDTYGLIDIYTNTESNKRVYYYSNGKYKKVATIFLAPKNSLDIRITTNRDEYKPGDNIDIFFDLKDKDGKGVDAALLVSMLDNSVLNLAYNDLSIDDIKLALEDIKLSDDTDLASLYSAIMNETNEYVLRTLLIKQNADKIFESYKLIRTTYDEEKYTNSYRLYIVLFIIILCTYLFIRFKKIRNYILSLPSFIIFTVAFTTFLYLFVWRIMNVSWNYEYDFTVNLTLLIISTIVSYYLNKKTFWKKISDFNKVTIVYIVLYLLLLILFNLNEIKYKYDIEPWNIINGLCLFAIIFIAITLILNYRLKKDKIVSDKIKNCILKINKGLKYFGLTILSVVILIIGIWLYMVIVNAIFSYDFKDFMELLLVLLVPFMAYFIPLKLIEEEFKSINSNKETKEVTIHLSFGTIVVIIGVGIIILFLISIGIMIYNNATGSVGSAMDSMSTSSYYDSMDSVSKSSNSTRYPASIDAGATPISASPDISNLFDLPSFETKSKDDNYNSDITSIVDSSSNTEHIRSVFLESMCFIPELIAKDGKANLNIDLSDNITTWTIQTVANTKDGIISSGKKDNVKVFKDFFVDFELPNNLVVGDLVNVPITCYNYTDDVLNVHFRVIDNDWFTVTENQDVRITLNPKETRLIYAPMIINKDGENIYRVESSSDNYSDIVEKKVLVYPKGYKIEKIVSNGVLDRDINEDILVLEDYIENTAKANVKIYPNYISQTIEGIESVFRMPTGCFEQVSSSLYPDIVALKYLKNNKIEDANLTKRALDYINVGYQKLLTYEVNSEKGGFSLYGKSPAETALTAFGLMEFKELSEVYNIDENLIPRIVSYLYSMQNSDGSFKIEGYHTGYIGSYNNLGLNAYIVWALSEIDNKDSRLKKSITYLENQYSASNSTYTKALIANALINCNSSKANIVLEEIINNIQSDEKYSYISSSGYDYYGSYGRNLNVSTTALVSIACSKAKKYQDTNSKLIEYIISSKDFNGNWYSTQSTIWAFKAINEYSLKNELPSQKIKISLAGQTKEIEIKDTALDYYEVEFNNLQKENKLNIDIEDGEANYLVTTSYYIPYENVNLDDAKIEVKTSYKDNIDTNEVLEANIKVANLNDKEIYNGMVIVDIPQGFVVDESSLQKLVSNNLIEKYEMNYRTINLYIRNFEVNNVLDLNVLFRASYPVRITGLSVKAYDYYNPEVYGVALPRLIVVN